jgi:hypothetical protein
MHAHGDAYISKCSARPSSHAGRSHSLLNQWHHRSAALPDGDQMPRAALAASELDRQSVAKAKPTLSVLPLPTTVSNTAQQVPSDTYGSVDLERDDQLRAHRTFATPDGSSGRQRIVRGRSSSTSDVSGDAVDQPVASLSITA